MKKVLTIVLTTMLLVFGGEAALAKDHDHRKCKDKHHAKGKVVYVDKKYRGYDDCKHCKSHRDRRYENKSCCSHHNDRYSRNDRRWERDRDHGRDRDYDRNHRGRVEDRRHVPTSREERERAIAKVILEERHRSQNKR
ncbi:hypothetical protein [Pontibacter indicus]|uniref:Uncharacterized protein n=1 Tax=Pontibacter indicus TaxID=1317125 RepID=A0A1R3XE16_9BACT|nr:hypothetical protein [Pontibacter indicus]SIT89664.1 hypothetical protein SAMN05444128_2085 [Pontibacter indicus]